MDVHGEHYRSIWCDPEKGVQVIDQRWLPHRFTIATLDTLGEFETAIRDMWVRGAPLIGATAAYGIARAMARDASDAKLAEARERLLATRPTAVNLAWALDRMAARLRPLGPAERAEAAHNEADAIAEADVDCNRRIGDHGLEIVKGIAAAKPPGEPVRILTHCNAGWLATVDWGTATAPIFRAHAEGIAVHVWVDETRPRNQGAQLTAWEMAGHGVAHHLIADNAGGHLMQQRAVDLVIVGTDRTAANGDVCNKIGTYLKALAAHDTGVPFYVALPSPTIDWSLASGVGSVPIEQRDPAEVTHVQGQLENGTTGRVRICPEETEAQNPAFDVTPARLVTGLITERGLCDATTAGLAALFPEHAQSP